jgi:NAD(P)-dependent dehydrogenase (short-subunit alcohol dehydrogenase family)
MSKKFENKSVVITGAASGIGRATALAFASEGGKVMVSDINETGGQETVAMIKNQGGEAAFFKANVANKDEVSALMAATVKTFGSLDVGVNNAGVGGPWSKLSHLSFEDFDQIMAVNLYGVYYCMKEQLNIMLEQGGGAIVNISSIAGLKGFANSGAYSASKHGVLGLTKSAALEFARKNIRVNAVCPVFTRSAMFDQLFELDPTFKDKLLKTIPMRRYGQPEDIAEAIIWLCSDQSSFITGLCLPADGGMTAG